MNDALLTALGNLGGDVPLLSGMKELLNALGYRSHRTAEAGSVEEFLERFMTNVHFTEKQRNLFKPWIAVEIVFQLTSREICAQSSMLDPPPIFENGRIESFLFLAVEIAEDTYTRTHLAETTRTINRRYAMPVILLFRHGSTLTLAATHRRINKLDDSWDVLEKVTMVKDIRANNPHRAHLEILASLALPRMLKSGVSSFDELHAAWEHVLDIEELNRRFYRHLFAWFQQAVAECRFPDDNSGNGSIERHVIRLITRLLFIWFLREKKLMPDKFFEQNYARSILKHYAPDNSHYYQAVLQNLFFATLNKEIAKRTFSDGTDTTYRDFTKYHYRGLLVNPDGFVEELKQVPFVNGGLFDCLDEFTDEGACQIDVFTDDIENQAKHLHVPTSLLLDEKDGLFPLFRRYKFTVEENTPLDLEVALDPELLGRVFENLLAAYNPETRNTARKKTGTYYTPRLVVDYMVQEALAEALAVQAAPDDGDPKFWRERIDYILDHSRAMDDACDFFSDSEKKSLVTTIASLKVLDPAVGSGAFPMGVLQKLTLVLRRLDPENTYWEEIQKELAKVNAGTTFDTYDRQQRIEALCEINDTFEKYRDSDYGRKLYLIQNCIYAVDIQPIACQIAKLRFFISLAIEQDTDIGAPNLGIKPLPNLETRFVAADTLIGLYHTPQMELGQTDSVSKLEKELAANRERHFHARNGEIKFRLRDEDKKLRAHLANELQRAGLSPKAASNIAMWDPYDQNTSARWFDPAYMFGVSNGFDIVIGNPPYIQLQKDGGRTGKKYKGAGYESFVGRGDIYQLFYERGCGLLKQNIGILAYITSNSWLKAVYGKSLRRWFAQRHTPLRLIEMGKDVFDAIVDACILLVCEGGDKTNSLPAVDIDHLEGGSFPPPVKLWGEARPDDDVPWSILSPIEWCVLNKMKAKGIPLKDWDVQIKLGVRSGYNKAFIIDSVTRNALIAEDSRSDEIIKPVLGGKDIGRWRAQWAGKWVIVAKFGSYKFLAADYPAVYRYLVKYETALRARGQCRYTPGGLGQNPDYKGQHHWLELDNNPKDDFISLFSKEKIFWIALADRGRFAFDDTGLFSKNSAFFLTGVHLKFLCAILNAKLTHWFLRSTAPTSGMGTLQWEKVYVEVVPIPKISPDTQRPFIHLVDRVIAAKYADPNVNVTEEEEEINCLVYALYNLNAAEISAVEKVVSL